MVRERSILRQLAATATEIADSAYRPLGREAKAVLDEAEAKVLHIAEQGSRGTQNFQEIGKLLATVVDRIEQLYNRDDPSDVTGVATGYADLDRMTSGLQPGDLVVIAGRPSMGKSALSLNIGEHVALHLKLPVAVFSMEMGAAQLAQRMIGSVGRLDQHKLRTGRISHEDWDRLAEALGRLNDAPILIDETPALNAIEIRSRARRLSKQYGRLGLVIVDYLQLMQASTQGENRATEISEISRAMKSLAKELSVPVVALSQLNRSLEQRPNKRPVMSDLRECVTGDTLVNLADGRRVAIRHLVGTTPEVTAVDSSQRLVSARSDLVWSKGVRPVSRITLASGRELRATSSHRLLAAEGWREVSQLDMRDRIGVARDAASDLFWDRVVAIEPAGDEEVFDLTVPGPACWLADGIVSHNSGAIEQDADVILFIYRDEVYNPESQDKGIAEIIIGKQRNGPIGTVRLTFLGEYTRFENAAQSQRS
ncbi:MAG: replicative DNA helicase [Proteobacteria bacterium]|nr:replicative DNA helicase [Pseudomonadota bacterium]